MLLCRGVWSGPPGGRVVVPVAGGGAAAGGVAFEQTQRVGRRIVGLGHPFRRKGAEHLGHRQPLGGESLQVPREFGPRSAGHHLVRGRRVESVPDEGLHRYPIGPGLPQRGVGAVVSHDGADVAGRVGDLGEPVAGYIAQHRRDRAPLPVKLGEVAPQLRITPAVALHELGGVLAKGLDQQRPSGLLLDPDPRGVDVGGTALARPALPARSRGGGGVVDGPAGWCRGGCPVGRARRGGAGSQTVRWAGPARRRRG